MVGEFPELQGVMGRYYAAQQGEEASVATAIEDHYKPQGPSDRIPTSPVSIAVALADKLDTLGGFWAINEKPTGSKDPFALRRAALGVIRIVLENGLRLPLTGPLNAAIWGALLDVEFAREDEAGAVVQSLEKRGFPKGPELDEIVGVVSRAARRAEIPDDERLAALTKSLIDFFADRLKVYLRDKGARHDLIDAVFALPGQDDLLMAVWRVEALGRLLETEDGGNLLAGYRRAANILKAEEKKDGVGAFAGPHDPAKLALPAERDLADALAAAGATAREKVGREDFEGAMRALATLRAPVDAFFLDVTVNADDPALRLNRLRLLGELRERGPRGRRFFQGCRVAALARCSARGRDRPLRGPTASVFGYRHVRAAIWRSKRPALPGFRGRMRLATATARISDGRRRDGRQAAPAKHRAMSLAFRLAIAALAALTGVFATAEAFAESGECARLRAAIASAPRGGGGQTRRSGGAPALRTCPHQRLRQFDRLQQPEVPVFRLRAAAPVRRDQRADRPHAGLALGSRGAFRRRPRGSDRALQRRMRRGRRPAAGKHFPGLVRRRREAPTMPVNPETLPPEEQQQTIEKSIENEKKSANASAGSYGVCVRTCDGSFFPVSYSGASERLEDVCRSLCPAADVQIYSFPFGGTIEQAESLSGERYVDMPNALKFQQSVDPTCSCRRKGESWAQALAAAEAKYGHEAKDILVTPEKSLEMSRPIIAKVSADPKAKPGKTNGKPAPRRRIRPPQPKPEPEPEPSSPRARRRSEPDRRRAGPQRQRRGHRPERRRGDRQPRNVRHRRRRRAVGNVLQHESGQDGHRDRPERGQYEGADSRASALARPISGSRAASSGPDSRPVSASRNG